MDPQFLEIAYDACDVLVNSRQFFSSAALAAHRPTQSEIPYCGRSVLWKGSPILVFDLTGCLSSIFTFVAPEGSTAVLFADAADFSEAHRLAFRALVAQIGGGLSADRLGLGVRSALRLTSIPLGQLKPVPSLIRSRCLRRGLVALRFARDDRSQYLIDVETIVFDAVGSALGSRQ